MSDVIISVENLGKKYAIRHEAERGRYKTLRETLMNSAASLVRRRPEAERTRTREEFWALKNVSFELERGKVLGIIGRNGAGKSTLLKVLSRITEPSEGRVTIRGRVASLLEVGTGFHPELTGRENIFLNGSILGMSRVEIRRKFDEIVDFAGIEKFLDTPVKRYSSGMYVRLAFAVAAHLEPEILIVDEVLAVGDAEFQKKCLGKMQDVTRGGRTVIFVSHNMGAIAQLCTRAVLLRSGSIAADGSCDTVTPRYLEDALEGSGGLVDLRRHPARQPSYRPLIVAAAIRNEHNQIVTEVIPEQPLIFELHLDAPSRINNARVAIAIEDSRGGRLVTFASYFGPQAQCLSKLEGTMLVQCQVDQLSLAPGRYLLSASVGTRDDGLIDSIDNALWFDVRWNNNYGSNEPYLPVYGPLLGESQWQASRQG
jgi:lipopolysaccharide transport system ATP-binding protein